MLLLALLLSLSACGTAPQSVSVATSQAAAAPPKATASTLNAEEAKVCTITAEALAGATQLPAVSPASIPNWHGTTMYLEDIPQQYGRFLAEEQDIAEVAEMGFNYLRLALTCKDFSAMQSGTFVFIANKLENIDRIVEWCAKYGIHLCIDMHELPGYGFEERTVLEEPEKLAQALQIWDVLSARYQDVPANLLSYNLVNEPDSSYFNDETYAAFAGKIIAVIRANDKTKKLLVSDGMLTGEKAWSGACPTQPVTGMPNDVMQTIHLYPWHAGNRAGYISLLQWPYEHKDGVNNFVQQGKAFVLKGDFKAGTIVTLYLNTVYNSDESGSIVCSADGKEVGTYSLRTFIKGHDGCTDVEENGSAFFDSGDKDGLVVEFEIPADCSKISIAPAGTCGGFVMKELLVRLPSSQENTYPVPQNSLENGFVYETGKYTAVYVNTAMSWDETPSALVINPDGTYTVENPASADVFDMESLRACVKSWADWSKQTGTPIMCNEFGIYIGLPKEVRLAYMRSVLDLFEEYDIPWCIFSNKLQCWSPSVAERNVRKGLTTLPVDDSLTLKDGFWYDEPMLELFKEYTQK